MFNELVPAIKEGMMSTSGEIPVVFDGLEHVFEKTTPFSESSSHETHELLFLRDGEAEMKIAGRNVILMKGDTIIIRPHMKHKMRVTSKQADILSLYFGFTPEVQNNYENKDPNPSKINPDGTVRAGPLSPLPRLAQTSLESFMQFATEGEESRAKDAYINVSGSYKQDVIQVTERIIEEKKDPDNYGHELMMELLTVELMLILSRFIQSEWEEYLRVKNGKAKELVDIAKKYMDVNYDRGITVNDAASYVFLSQGYFTRAFKDNVGISPMNYLMNVRIDKACEMLRNPDIKVSAIATAVGFSSAQRFNVAFKKHKGITPMDYRKQVTNTSGRSDN